MAARIKSMLSILTAACLISVQGCTIPRIAMRNVPVSFHTPASVQKLNRRNVPSGTRLSATWIGHSTVLLQMDDLFVLTDPILTSRIGLVSKRLVEPGMDLSAIPPLTVVLMSHRHFDHLSPKSLKLLGDRLHTVIVPPGLRPDLPKGKYAVVELITWQSHTMNGLEVTAVPAVHEGGRTIGDNASHPLSFTGFLLRYHGLSVYYPGDTAFRKDLFTRVNQRFGPVDLALLPIGPIEPPKLMLKSHMDPRQALDAATLLQAHVMLPVHFETFINSLDKPGEDREALMKAQTAAPPTLKVIDWHIGESVVVQ